MYLDDSFQFRVVRYYPGVVLDRGHAKNIGFRVFDIVEDKFLTDAGKYSLGSFIYDTLLKVFKSFKFVARCRKYYLMGCCDSRFNV